MSWQENYSALDRPEVLQIAFYPRQYFTTCPPGATDHVIPVAEGVSISCRLYRHSQSSPTILYFHGNGEVASDYDDVAPLYSQLGINLFVADYRGYGASGGAPNFISMVADCHIIFRALSRILGQGHYTGGLFIMGRSAGSIPAVELAFSYPQEFRGLILESGFASMLNLLSYLGFPVGILDLTDTSFPNAARLRAIRLPLLIIHGGGDSLVPPSEARALFEAAGGPKRLVIIPGAGHNDLMWVGGEAYFRAVGEFVLTPVRATPG